MGDEKEILIYFYLAKDNKTVRQNVAEKQKAEKQKTERLKAGKVSNARKVTGVSRNKRELLKNKLLLWKRAIKIELEYRRLLKSTQAETLNIEKIDCGTVSVFFCKLPMTRKQMEIYGGAKCELLIKSVLQSLCKVDAITEERTVNVCYQMELAEYLEVPQTEFSLEVVCFLYKRYVKNDVLIIRDGEQAKRFAEAVYADLNQLFILTGNRENWEEIEAFIYEDSGLVIQYNFVPTRIFGNKDKVCCFDFSGELLRDYRMLPKDAIYIDMAPTCEKRRILAGKRKDVTYLDCPNALTRV